VLVRDQEAWLHDVNVITVICESLRENLGPACRRRAFEEYVGSGRDVGTACLGVARWTGDLYQESCSFLRQTGADAASVDAACARTREAVVATLRDKCQH
jgi:hypothetical protein